MGTGQDKDSENGLKYVKEHATCENYITGKRAILGLVELKADELFVREDLGRSTLVFVLRGIIHVSTGGTVDRPVGEGCMLLVPAGDSFYGRAKTEVTLLRSSFMQDMALCNKFSLKQLLDYVPETCETSAPTVLPIRKLLLEELEMTASVMRTRLLCIHYQRVKTEIIFLELRAFYTKEELARFFAPVLAQDGDFKTDVLRQFPHVHDANELINRMGMAVATFKRKFQNAFGMPVGQWIIQKKKEKLFRDIVMTETTIRELARKYGFTEGYLTMFCRKHFGATPTELRAKYNAP